MESKASETVTATSGSRADSLTASRWTIVGRTTGSRLLGVRNWRRDETCANDWSGQDLWSHHFSRPICRPSRHLQSRRRVVHARGKSSVSPRGGHPRRGCGGPLGDGAEVAFEACGCGGGGQCKPYWPEKAKIKALSRSSLPQMSPRPTAPTWIDVWAGDGTTVVFCHGDITWGSLLP